VAPADSAANEVPALANGVTAIELEDGRRFFAPAGVRPAEVKRQLAGKTTPLGMIGQYACA
jgi:hypothetical protein